MFGKTSSAANLHAIELHALPLGFLYITVCCVSDPINTNHQPIPTGYQSNGVGSFSCTMVAASMIVYNAPSLYHFESFPDTHATHKL